MIHSAQNTDPVIRDLNRYLAEEEQYDAKREYFEAKAEHEFNMLSDIELIEYQENYDDLESLFDFVRRGKTDEAMKALNDFIETVKKSFIENTLKDFEMEEQKERESDEYMERYFLENGYPSWY
jgi:hypothetical protein